MWMFSSEELTRELSLALIFLFFFLFVLYALAKTTRLVSLGFYAANARMRTRKGCRGSSTVF